jgi:hypothetical protein
MGQDGDGPPVVPSKEKPYEYEFIEDHVRRSKAIVASIVVVIIVLLAVLVVRWYSDRVDCRLDVTVNLRVFPGYEPPEPIEGLDIEIVLYKGRFPQNQREVDRKTLRTDGNGTARGILDVKSVGEYEVWMVVFDEACIGDVVEVTESNDGKTIPVTLWMTLG